MKTSHKVEVVVFSVSLVVLLFLTVHYSHNKVFLICFGFLSFLAAINLLLSIKDIIIWKRKLKEVRENG